ncbi:MAG: histidine phosphatase family protein [Chloroflexota bacterium]
MIYLMRHGESVVNVERRLTCRKRDGDLTTNGRTQGEKAARWFADKGLTQIRYSPFHRAEQTAQIVGAVVGLTPVPDDDLVEMDCGNLEWLTDEAAWKVWTEVYQRWLMYDLDARFPEGESYGEAVARFSRALARVAPQGNTLLVTHGGVTVTTIPPLCVNAAAMQWVEHLVNTGIIVLEHYDAERYSCSAWNLIEHLND